MPLCARPGQEHRHRGPSKERYDRARQYRPQRSRDRWPRKLSGRDPALEIPVVTPSRASMDTVNAVECRDSFACDINFNPRWSQRCWVSARQIRPRPYVAMKLITSGVAICAGMTRSPSFSRSSSSTRINIRPFRASSMISSIEEKIQIFACAAHVLLADGDKISCFVRHPLPLSSF